MEKSDGRTARRGDSQRRILRAAAELFAERGFGSTTMDEVADAAGVSKGTIFYNYSGKAELCGRVIENAAEALASVIADARAGRRGWDALSAVTVAVMERIDAEPALAHFLMSEMFRTNRPWSDALASARDRLLTPLIALVCEVAEERRAAGVQLDAAYPGNARSVAASLLGALVTATLDRRAYPGQTLEEVNAGLQAAISGLRAPVDTVVL